MEQHQIQKLLDKYLEGSTSIQEEQLLKSFFTSKEVPKEWQVYQDLFGFFASEQTIESTTPLRLHPKRKTSQILWLSVAAMAVLFVGLGIILSTPQSVHANTLDDPETAFKETQKALDLIAQNLQKGKESVKYLNHYEITKNKVFK